MPEQQNKVDYTRNVKYWKDIWDHDNTFWHKRGAHTMLQQCVEDMTSGGMSRKFFVPLCGKTQDIPYLYHLGHSIFGVDAVPKAIEELSQENDLGLTFNEEKSIYSSQDGRIVIYCGDIFTCPFEKFGPFDCVWDRGSFIALEFGFRPAYKEMIQRSLKANSGKYCNFKYLLETIEYDREKFGGPPRAADIRDVWEYFGDWAEIRLVSRKVEMDGYKHHFGQIPNLGPVIQAVYMLTPKFH